MAKESGSDFLRYLAEQPYTAGERLPAIAEIASELGLSVGKLREQLEVARELGLVDIRPKTGIRSLGFSFHPSVWASLRIALALDPGQFDHFESLRHCVEGAFFLEAARLLQPEEKARLQELIRRAWQLLQGEPIQIPHAEHRELHLTVFSRLKNPFVRGILEAYWDAYETVGLNLYADYRFLNEVWTYHERMVNLILSGDFDAAHTTLVKHNALLLKRPKLARARPTVGAGAGKGESMPARRRVAG
jgi:DNA-binding FadR family transcriptional regulator